MSCPYLADEKAAKQLVGLLTEDPATRCCQTAPMRSTSVTEKLPMDMIGQVTSTYWSPTLERSIAMALIKDGQNRMGETISFPLEGGKVVQARIVDPVFYDKEGARQNV